MESPIHESFHVKSSRVHGADHDACRHLKGRWCRWTQGAPSPAPVRIVSQFAWVNLWRNASRERCHCGCLQGKWPSMIYRQVFECQILILSLFHCSKGRGDGEEEEKKKTQTGFQLLLEGRGHSSWKMSRARSATFLWLISVCWTEDPAMKQVLWATFIVSIKVKALCEKCFLQVLCCQKSSQSRLRNFTQHLQCNNHGCTDRIWHMPWFHTCMTWALALFSLLRRPYRDLGGLSKWAHILGAGWWLEPGRLSASQGPNHSVIPTNIISLGFPHDPHLH